MKDRKTELKKDRIKEIKTKTNNKQSRRTAKSGNKTEKKTSEHKH